MTSFLDYWLAPCLLTLADVHNEKTFLSVRPGNTNVPSGVLKRPQMSKSLFARQADALKFVISHPGWPALAALPVMLKLTSWSQDSQVAPRIYVWVSVLKKVFCNYSAAVSWPWSQDEGAHRGRGRVSVGFPFLPAQSLHSNLLFADNPTMFGAFKADRLKVNLRLVINRLKLLEKKKSKENASLFSVKCGYPACL